MPTTPTITNVIDNALPGSQSSTIQIEEEKERSYIIFKIQDDCLRLSLNQKIVKTNTDDLCNQCIDTGTLRILRATFLEPPEDLFEANRYIEKNLSIKEDLFDVTLFLNESFWISGNLNPKSLKIWCKETPKRNNCLPRYQLGKIDRLSQISSIML